MPRRVLRTRNVRYCLGWQGVFVEINRQLLSMVPRRAVPSRGSIAVPKQTSPVAQATPQGKHVLNLTHSPTVAPSKPIQLNCARVVSPDSGRVVPMRERAWAPKCCSRCSDGRGACERGPPRSDSLIDACQLLVVQQAMASAASAETATALVCRLASAQMHVRYKAPPVASTTYRRL
jgi:hypothetical protein